MVTFFNSNPGRNAVIVLFSKVSYSRFTALENKMSWLNETCPSYTGISTWKLLLILLTVTLVFSAAVWLSKETEEGGEVCLGYHGNGDSC